MDQNKFKFACEFMHQALISIQNRKMVNIQIFGKYIFDNLFLVHDDISEI